MSANDYYFCLYLTESEHELVREELHEVCAENNCTLQYYRKLKDGHIPCYREVKVSSNDPAGLGLGLGRVKGWMEGMLLTPERNPHKRKNHD